VIYAFGHGHVGMTAAPMTGRIVADLLSGRTASIDIAPSPPPGSREDGSLKSTAVFVKSP